MPNDLYSNPVAYCIVIFSSAFFVSILWAFHAVFREITCVLKNRHLALFFFLIDTPSTVPYGTGHTLSEFGTGTVQLIGTNTEFFP
jgi:hypothetical protein